MDTVFWIIICVVCVFSGGAVTYILLNKKTEALKADNMRIAAKLESETEAKNRYFAERDELAQKNEQLNIQLQKAMSEGAAEAEKTKWVDQADKNLREAFSALSKDIIDQNNNLFLERANDKLNDFAAKLDQKMAGESKNVSSIVTPVGEQLKELQKQVFEMENKRASAYSGLFTTVDELRKQNDILKSETHSLNSALRNSSVRGKWGEEQLRRIAELSGMIEHIDFEEQYVNDDGKRPDMTVMLTGDRVIPVDSKVPMDEYLLYAECTDNNERAAHLDKHIRAVKRHIDALGKKEYWKSAERSVQFVVMVVPYESGLSAIFEADQGIFQYALEKNVLLLSPMTFYAFLKSVSLGWSEYNMAENAKEISKLSAELIERFDRFMKYMEDIGANMGKAVLKYNEAVNSYNKRLLPTFNKIKSLNDKTENEPLELAENVLNVHLSDND